MAKTKSEMFALIGGNFPDNTTGAITPEKLREVTTQLADSMLYAATGVKEVEVLRALLLSHKHQRQLTLRYSYLLAQLRARHLTQL